MAPFGYRPADGNFTAEDISTAYTDMFWLMHQQEQQNQLTRDESISFLISGLKAKGRIEKIELDTVVFSGRNKCLPTTEPTLTWIAIFIQATKVYCITKSAIARSRIAPTALSIYQETAMQCVIT